MIPAVCAVSAVITYAVAGATRIGGRGYKRIGHDRGSYLRSHRFVVGKRGGSLGGLSVW